MDPGWRDTIPPRHRLGASWNGMPSFHPLFRILERKFSFLALRPFGVLAWMAFLFLWSVSPISLVFPSLEKKYTSSSPAFRCAREASTKRGGEGRQWIAWKIGWGRTKRICCRCRNKGLFPRWIEPMEKLVLFLAFRTLFHFLFGFFVEQISPQFYISHIQGNVIQSSLTDLITE